MGTIKKECVVRVRQPPQDDPSRVSAYRRRCASGHLPRPRSSDEIGDAVRWVMRINATSFRPYEKARAITRASKNVEVWNWSAQVGWPNALVTPVLRGSTVASVTF
jgi:hypothetical protein